jgi:hypothetical protein
MPEVHTRAPVDAIERALAAAHFDLQSLACIVRS